MEDIKINVDDLHLYYGENHALKGVNMKIKCYERIERELKEKPKSIYLVDENKKVIEWRRYIW